MATSGAGYPLPGSAEELERLCLKLLRRHWQIPQLERVRDSGRREKGIHLLEISGRPRLAAVRCELREAQNALQAKEIKDAAERALSFGLPIGRFVIATTAARSDSHKRTLYDLNRAHKGGVAVELITWNDIQELLDEYPQILTELGAGAKRQAITRADCVVQLEPRPVMAEPNGAPPDALEAEITAAAEAIGRRDCQMARLGLLRLREQCWSELNPSQKFRVLTNLGVAWMGEGESRRAAMLFIAARSLQPEDEQACTNEALAHELLGERDRAHALADRLRSQFPSSGRALALWLNNAPLATDAVALESTVPPELGADPEVAMVMARRALGTADYLRAERYARSASQSMQGQSDPWLILGQSILLADLSGAVAVATTPANAESGGPPAEPPESSRLREAETCFTQAIELARAESSAQNEVQGLIGRAQARIALHDADGAGKDIEQAHTLKREDASALVEYGIVLRARGSLNEAIAAFERAAAVGGRDDAEYHLAITLRERDDPGDIQSAAEMLTRAIARPECVPRDEFPFALSAAIDVLGRLERWHEADALLASASDDRIAPASQKLLRANLRIAQGKFDQASTLADEVLAAQNGAATNDSATSPEERRKLAALLHDLGRYRDALPLWQSLQSSAGPADMRRLIDCALRLGREDILTQLSSAPDGAENAPPPSETDLERLERNDPEAALQVIQQHLAQHPEDAVMRLRRSIVADRIGRRELVIADPSSMPFAKAVPPALGREAVRIMREGGRASEALSYAYDMLRRRPNDIDAHRAFLGALGPIGPVPHIADFDTAAPGAAVCFAEQDTNVDKWIVLEDADEPDESIDEYGPVSPMAKALKGKRVGDKFQLPEGRFSRKSGVVRQIVSKYAWRFQDSAGGWSRRFPGQPEVEIEPPRAEPVDWSALPERLDDLLGSATRRDDVLNTVDRVYAANPIPLHAIADRLGVNDLQTMFLLAQRPESTVQCCYGAPAELEEAVGFFDRASAVVIDLTAIATLCMLGRLHLLATWPRQFVVSQGTLAELRRLQFEEALLKLPPGFSASVSGNPNDAKLRTDVQLKSLADGIQSVCRVRDGAALAVVDGDRREHLVRMLGRHGAESVVLAAMPGHVLWTDDRVLAGFAKSEFGVRRVWTGAALQSRVRAGCLDPAELATANTKLSGWSYSFTPPTIDSLLRAGAVAMWNPDQFPLRQALDHFTSPAIGLADAMRLGVELIVRTFNDANLRGARRALTMRLIDRLASRPQGREAIEALPRSLPIRFGLDLIRARELSDVIRGWMASSAAQPASAQNQPSRPREVHASA